MSAPDFSTKNVRICDKYVIIYNVTVGTTRSEVIFRKSFSGPVEFFSSHPRCPNIIYLRTQWVSTQNHGLLEYAFRVLMPQHVNKLLGLEQTSKGS